MDREGGSLVVQNTTGTAQATMPRGAPTRERNEADQLALVSMEIAVEFLGKVYFRTHNSLREDILEWKETMQV